MSPVPECSSPQPPAPPVQEQGQQLQHQQQTFAPTTLDNIFSNGGGGGGGSSDGRGGVNNAAVVNPSGGAAAAVASASSAGVQDSFSSSPQQQQQQQPNTHNNNDNTNNKNDTTNKVFNESQVVFDYGVCENTYLTTNAATSKRVLASVPAESGGSALQLSTNDHLPHHTQNIGQHTTSSPFAGASGFASIPEGSILGGETEAYLNQQESVFYPQLHYDQQQNQEHISSLPPMAPHSLQRGADTLLATTGPAQHNNNPSTTTTTSTSKQPQLAGPNELFFGTGGERSSGASHRDREERLKQLRDKQTVERQQKLEELKEHAREWSEQAAAAQRFREQQEAQRKQRLYELRSRDQDRRLQVEERRKYMEQADQHRREASFRKNLERDQRLETKRRNERSNIVFAFGSSTPRMLDPKENVSYWASRRATSSSNVTLGADGSSLSGNRRSSDCVDTVTPNSATLATGAPDLARKRATSAQGLDRNPSDMRMSSSMYEVFHWTDNASTGYSPQTPQGGEDLMSRSMTGSVARRRTDLHPITPSLRDASGKPRHRSPGIGSSGLVTPSSRPTSALSQTSSTAQSGVAMRARPAAARSKPRPMSIAGSAPTAADRPRSPNSRETRSTLRNTSSSSISSIKSNRAKSAGGSDSSGPTTPARTVASAAPRTPKRTPGQVKAENAAKKAEKAKAAASTTAAAATKRPATKTAPSTSVTAENKAPTTVSKKAIEKKTTTAAKTESDDKTEKATDSSDITTIVTEAVSEGKSSKSETETMEVVENGTETTVVVESQETVVVTAEDSSAVSDVAGQVVNKSDVITEVENGQTVVTTTTTTTTESSVSGKIEELTTTQKTVEEPSNVVENGETTTTAVIEMKEFNVEESSKAITNGTDVGTTNGISNGVTPTNEEVATNIVAPTNEEVATNSVAPTSEEVATNGVALATEKVANNEGTNGSTPSAAERPVTGYATEEEYKAALAEKRRLAREAKEREIELERKRQEAEIEKERQEEADMLRVMEEQKKAEEERFKKAIEEADKLRKEEEQRKEEEEKQRIEAEVLEKERQREAEEKNRREEEERLSRKSRVAAIMARTRNRGSTTPNKAESQTPSEENKSINDVLQNANLTDSMIDKMSDSMIAAATTSIESEGESCQASSGIASEPVSDFSSQPGSDVSNNQQQMSEMSSHSTVEASLECLTSGASSLEQTVRIDDPKIQMQDQSIDLLSTGVAQINVQEHTNGNSTVPMDTTPTQSIDILGSFNGHTNGVDNSHNQHNNQSVDLLGSFDPFASAGTPSSDPNTTDFEQIIEASQTKLNEDAINSNPPAPFIAFEQNLNNKSNQDSTSVPDILL